LDNFYKTIVNTFNIKTWSTATKQTAKELVTLKGLGKLGIGVGLGVTFATFMEEKSLKKGYKGPEIKEAKEGLVLMSQTPKDEGGYPELRFKGPIDDVFDDNLEKNLIKVQKFYNKKVTGTLTPDMALVLGVNYGLEPGVAERIFGKKRVENFALGLVEAENWLKTAFGVAQREAQALKK